MQTRIYNGPSPGVEVPLDDGTTVTAVKGEPTELPDETAQRLDEQDCWWKTPEEADAAAAAKAKALAEADPRNWAETAEEQGERVEDALSTETVAQLRARAEELELEVPNSAKKAEIVALLVEEYTQSLAADDGGDSAAADAQTSPDPGTSTTADGGKE